MNVIRSLITLLILLIVILSALGIVWWNTPPEKLAESAGFAKGILAVLIASGLAGVIGLWRPVAPKHGG